MPVKTIRISVKIGALFFRAARPASTGELLNRRRSAIAQSPTAIEHLCRIRSSGVVFPTAARARLRLREEMENPSGVSAPISIYVFSVVTAGCNDSFDIFFLLPDSAFFAADN